MTLLNRVKRRLSRKGRQRPLAAEAPTWHTVTAGPLTGGRIFVPADRRVFRLMIDGKYDDYLLEALQKKCGNLHGKVVWDVGSHIGYDALLFSSLVGPGGSVIAFEPNLRNAERLRLHLQHNPTLAERITLKEVALSNEIGSRNFCAPSSVDTGDSSISFVEREGGAPPSATGKAFERVTIEAVTADSLIHDGMAPPQVMKIDVEEAEWFVLKGASKLLQDGDPVLVIEIHGVEQMYKVQHLLYELGYTVDLLSTWNTSEDRCFVIAYKTEAT